ncbi:hypothetical protein CBR_g48873 [Chara braunii]|uniref:Reverse transcriptase domain-containing protein n=1 Tax=Chara braunii TaxID=69332 RepID=A0A388M3U4_CHABU|nr:hypothetical protein CBR_g48873 [Chara braunii]|eukprot:GBG89165.1 hypothetical protein CBR_g48873 [Chara braunii]
MRKVFRLGTVNVRGLGERSIKWKTRELRKLVEREKLHILCLQETRLKEERIPRDGRREFGDGFRISAPTMGTMGGVAIITTRYFQGEVLDFLVDTQGRWVWIWMEMNGQKYLVTTVYGPSDTTDRKWFWRELPTHVPETTNTMLMGDFNIVICPGLNSAQGGQIRPDAEALKKMMAELEIKDAFRKTWPGEKGYTWTGPGPGRRSRLDMAWLQEDVMHRLVRVATRPVALLDHKLLMIEVLSPALVETQAPPPTVPHWMFRDLLHIRLIRQHWEYWEKLRTPGTSAAKHFQTGLQELANLLLARAKATRQAHMRTGQEFGERLEDLGADPPEGEEEEWCIQWAALKAQWEEWQKEDARKWRVVSKTKWVRLRERMSAAFFGQMQTRGRAMVITALQHPFRTDEPVAKTTQVILRYAETFYSDLYMESERWGKEEMREAARTGIWEKAATKLREEQSWELEEAITSQEITKAFADMPKRKAAGADGLPMDHLQAAEEVFMPLLQELCNASFVGGQRFPEGFGEATIILLHKREDLTNIKNWKPVSLLSAPYKLYAKILANRMTKFLLSLIHPTQTGFVPGRQILTNAIMAREVLHRAADTMPPVAVLLLDFEKAYDRVRWRFLIQGLEERGIGDMFGRAVGCLLATATTRVQINDFCSGLLSVTRSVRQGCPLSPTLYVLYVEHLHDMIRADHGIRGVHLPQGQDLKSNSFADDTAAFVECSQDCVQALRTLVQTFHHFAGAKVNWAKSLVLLPEGGEAACFPEMRILPQEQNTRYLGIMIPAALSTGQQMEELLSVTLTKMHRWTGRVEVGVVGRVLVANNAVSSTLWYVAPLSDPGNRAWRRYKTALRRYLWKNDPYVPHLIQGEVGEIDTAATGGRVGLVGSAQASNNAANENSALAPAGKG